MRDTIVFMKLSFWIGGLLTVAICIPLFVVQAALSLDANCVGAISAPTVIRAGARFNATATIKNNGLNTWTRKQLFYLGSQDPQDNNVWGIGRVDLPAESVPAKKTVTFTISATAPSKIGTYSFVWQMLQEKRAWFGQKCKTRKQITVIAALPTPTPTPTITPSITPTPTPTSGFLPTPTATPTATPYPSTPTPIVTPVVTINPYDSVTPQPNPYTNASALTATITSPVAKTSILKGQLLRVAVLGKGSPTCGTWKLIKPNGDTVVLTASDFASGQLPGGITPCTSSAY